MMPPAAHLDQHYADHHFFPGHGQFNNSETLEAVLRPPRAAPESGGPVVTAAPPPQGGRNGAAAAGQGHARARNRPFRTDRHSKIRTAQGVRDRRMRLSLDVARDFFALQDRLGFDKASKTVDWLLTQSKPAIDRLTEPSHQRCVGGGNAALSSPTSGAPNGSGNKSSRGGVVEKAGTRNGGSAAFLEHGCELDRLVPAAPVLGEYYYAGGLSEMMSNNGGEGDDEGEYEEDGDDFLDGMQY